MALNFICATIRAFKNAPISSLSSFYVIEVKVIPVLFKDFYIFYCSFLFYGIMGYIYLKAVPGL